MVAAALEGMGGPYPPRCSLSCWHQGLELMDKDCAHAEYLQEQAHQEAKLRNSAAGNIQPELMDLHMKTNAGKDIYPRPKPPYRPQPGDPNSGNIYPRPKPQPPRPQPGSSGHGGGYFSDVDRDDGRYPPRPRPPAGGGGGYNPSYDGYGHTNGGGGYAGYDNTQEPENI
ncbi:hypothetical protein MC885_001249 [Smutsia gigantea]|nr:hypothetical protein MC885_001249 [Smutsia gigantea]